jgi:hypothetical protein
MERKRPENRANTHLNLLPINWFPSSPAPLRELTYQPIDTRARNAPQSLTISPEMVNQLPTDI